MQKITLFLPPSFCALSLGSAERREQNIEKEKNTVSSRIDFPLFAGKETYTGEIRINESIRTGTAALLPDTPCMLEKSRGRIFPG